MAEDETDRYEVASPSVVMTSESKWHDGGNSFLSMVVQVYMLASMHKTLSMAFDQGCTSSSMTLHISVKATCCSMQMRDVSKYDS